VAAAVFSNPGWSQLVRNPRIELAAGARDAWFDSWLLLVLERLTELGELGFL